MQIEDLRIFIIVATDYVKSDFFKLDTFAYMNYVYIYKH